MYEAEPPTPTEILFSLKVSPIRKGSVRDEILGLLSKGRKFSVSCLARELGRSRGNIQRVLKKLKSEGWVRDEWVCVAPSVSSKIVAHLYTLNGEKNKMVNNSNALEEEIVHVPLRYHILSLFSGIPCFTVGSVSKLLKKDRKRVKEVLNSMKRAGLVDCHIDDSKMSSGYQPMTHFWTITEFGKKMANEEPESYKCFIRKHKFKADARF